MRDVLLILARRAAEFSAKHGMQVLRGFEAAMLRNVGDGGIGFFQSRSRRSQFEAKDFVMHAATARFAKVRFQ
jgi:hypothetical protein